MSPEKLTQEANTKIKTWLNDKDKLVVAIDGYTGVGKTTLSDNLVVINPEIVAVHYDDFLISTRELNEKLRVAGTNQREEVPHHNFDEIKRLVESFKNIEKIYQTKIFNPDTGEVDRLMSYDFVGKKILLIDGVFMFHPGRLNNLWDKRIYLDGNTAKIDERRIKRQKERWGDKYFPETHPDSHFRQLVIALKKYRQEYQPEKIADLVLNDQ